MKISTPVYNNFNNQNINPLWRKQTPHFGALFPAGKFPSIPPQLKASSKIIVNSFEECKEFAAITEESNLKPTRKNLISVLKQIKATPAYRFYCGLYTTNKSISNPVNKYPIFKDKTDKKLDFLNEMLQAAKSSKQALTPFDKYFEKIKIKALTAYIQKTSHFSTITELKALIENIQNKKIREKLKQLLNNKETKLLSENPNPKQMTPYQTGKLLSQFTSPDYKPLPEEIAKAQINFGEYSKAFLEKLRTPLSDRQIEELTQIINKNNGKYLDFWKNNPEKAAIYINSFTTNEGQLTKFGDKEWNLIIKNYKNFFEKNFVRDNVKALLCYCGISAYKTINCYLRADNKISYLINNIKKLNKTALKTNLEQLKDDITYNFSIGLTAKEQDETNYLLYNSIKKILKLADEPKSQNSANILNALKSLKLKINKIGDETNITKTIEDLKKFFIKSTEEDTGIFLTRNEDTKLFESFVLKGKNLRELMKKAKENPKARERVLKYFNEKQPAIERPFFISTSIHPYQALESNEIQWHLILDKDVKYCYTTDITQMFQNIYATESELLLAPNQKIKITSASFEEGRWHLNGRVMPE